MKTLKLAALSAILLSFSLQAKSLVMVSDRGQILVPEIKSWELAENMFGMPFLYFSPQENGQRSNISFTQTGVDTDMDLATLTKNPDSYKKIKAEWAESVDAKLGDFHPSKTWKNKNNHDVRQFSFEFTHEEKQYVETSYFVDCRGKLVYSKSLRLKANTAHQTQFETLIRDMDCGL